MRSMLQVLGLLALTAAVVPARAQIDPQPLRIVLAGELRSIDPDWTAAALTRYHAFMVYDTLLGTRCRPDHPAANGR